MHLVFKKQYKNDITLFPIKQKATNENIAIKIKIVYSIVCLLSSISNLNVHILCFKGLLYI